MVLAQGKKGIKSRSIERHHLFGWRFLDHHQFKTEKWALSTYAGQYKTMIDILAKNSEYSVLKARDERNKQKKILAQIAAECKMGRIKLQEGLLGNPQQVRNLLYNHREMQRLYQKMPSYMIVEDIDQKTFVLRKERDSLRYDRNKLLRLYERKKYLHSYS